MAGLLDMDPREYGVTQGLLGMGSALLTPVARGGGFAGVGPALMSAQANAMQMAEAQRAAKQREEEMAMRRQQFDLQLKDWQTKQAEVERQRAIEQQLGDAARQSFIPGQAQIDGTADPSRFDMAAFGQRALQIDPTGRGLAIYQSSQKDNTPITLKEGESLIDRQTLKPILSQPKAAAPTELARLTAERDQYPGGHPLRQVYDDAIRKATTHQPPASQVVNLPKIDVSMGDSAAKNVGEILMGSRTAAVAARQSVDSANRIVSALESGKVFAGPTASLRMAGAQIAETLGVGGADNRERIANTRNVVKGLAELAMQGSKYLSGQGAVSNYERDAINKAVSGDIDSLTIPEIKAIAEASRRSGRAINEEHKRLVSVARSKPTTGVSADFYDLPDMDTGGWSIRAK